MTIDGVFSPQVRLNGGETRDLILDGYNLRRHVWTFETATSFDCGTPFELENNGRILQKSSLCLLKILVMITALDIGNYSFAEAARFTKLRPARVREWFRGKSTGRQSLLESDFPSSGRDTSISFSDLVDVFVAGQLREHGVKMSTLRKVYQSLRQRYHVAHPFCRVELQTDGKSVFSIGLNDAGREEVTEVLVGQRVFPQIIKPFLKSLDYDEATGMALQWRVAPHVVLNPKLYFGRPVVDGACLPTSLLAAAYKANGGDAVCVADWYGATVAQVEAAVNFENQFRVRVAA